MLRRSILVVFLLTSACSGGGTAPDVGSASDPSATAEPVAATCDPPIIERSSGRNRIETAVAASRQGWTSADTVVLASAETFPDALAAGTFAARADAPILLTRPDALPQEVADELERLGTGRITIAGGPAAVSETVRRQLEAAGVTVDRLAGRDRFATAAALAQAVGGDGHAVVVNGSDFPDALSSGAFAATGDRIPTLLTASDHLPDATRQAVTDLELSDVTVVGGEQAVSQRVVDELAAAGVTVRRLAGADRYATSVAVAREVLTDIDARGFLAASGVDFPDALAAAPLAARTAGVVLLVPPEDLAKAPDVRDLVAAHADAWSCNALLGGTAAVSSTVEAQLAELVGASPPQATVTLAAAGDIAACNSSGDEATAELLDDIPGAIATLGDNAYPDGTPQEFARCYHPSWGRHLDRTRPSPGNHDYGTRGAAGYFDYFGDRAGEPGDGWYSYDLGPYWHVIALNSNCWAVGGCGEGSPQLEWLRADLAANADRNVIAYWHHPRFSSGLHGGSTDVRPLFGALYDARAEIVMAGHDHTYERFAPATPNGNPAPERGIRSFVVGTGGYYNYAFRSDPLPITEARNDSVKGVLVLTLERDRYAWRLETTDGRTLDRGSAAVVE